MSQNYDKGLAELARLALARNGRAVSNPKTSSRALILVLGPLYAIRWAGEVIAIVGAELIRKLLCRLRNPQLGEENCEITHALLAASLLLPYAITPRHWGIWASLISRYNPYEATDLEFWAGQTPRLQQSRIWTPTDLPGPGKDEISALPDDVGPQDHAII